MKKFFKKLLLALVLVPCALFAVACKKDPPPEEPPTQAEINANGFTKLKTVMPAFAAQNGDKTITTDTTMSSTTKVYNADGTEVTGDDFTALVGVSADQANRTAKSREKVTYNATTSEFAHRYYEEDAEHNLVMDTENYEGIKKVGDKYAQYVLDDYDGASAAYVSSEHYKYEYLDDTMWSDAGMEDTIGQNPAEFDSFDSMCDYMEEMLGQAMNDFAIGGDITTDFDAKFTESNGVWTFTISLDVMGEAVEGDEAGSEMEIGMDVIIVFTDNGLNSYEQNMQVNVTMEMPGEGTVTYDVVSGMTMNEKETYSATFDSSLALTATELATFDAITLENIEVRVMIASLTDNNSFSCPSYTYGDSLANIMDEDKEKYGPNVEIKLYRDEERTVEFNYATETMPSYEIRLYPELVAKEGYAVVIEDRSLTVWDSEGSWEDGNREQNVKVLAVATEGTYTYLTNVDFETDEYGWYDEYDTEDWDTITIDGVEKAATATTLTLEAGKTYKIVYEAELTLEPSVSA